MNYSFFFVPALCTQKPLSSNCTICCLNCGPYFLPCLTPPTLSLCAINSQEFELGHLPLLLFPVLGLEALQRVMCTAFLPIQAIKM